MARPIARPTARPIAKLDKGTRAGELRLPFSFNGVQLHTPGASSLLRVSLLPADNDTVSLLLAGETGELIASVDSLAGREESPRSSCW